MIVTIIINQCPTFSRIPSSRLLGHCEHLNKCLRNFSTYLSLRVVEKKWRKRKKKKNVHVTLLYNTLPHFHVVNLTHFKQYFPLPQLSHHALCARPRTQLLSLLRLQITYIAVTIALSETGSKSVELQIVSTKTHGETWR